MIRDYNDRGPVRNDPRLLRTVKVRCKCPFYVRGRPLEPGEVAAVEWHVARDMVALGRAELVD